MGQPDVDKSLIASGSVAVTTTITLGLIFAFGVIGLVPLALLGIGLIAFGIKPG